MTYSKQEVKTLFGARVAEWATYYSDREQQTMLARNLAVRQRLALEMVEDRVPRTSKVLDIGCGTGEIAAALIHRGYEVWGLDIAEPMIRHARDRCLSGRFQVGDIEHTPFADNTFDTAVCLGIIEYLDTDERALGEIHRILKPGGIAVLSSSNAISPLHLIDRILVVLTTPARRLYSLLKNRSGGTPDPLNQLSRKVAGRRYYRWKWLQQLRSVGLEPEEWVGEGWGWYRSRLWLWVPRLFRPLTLFRRSLEQLFGRARVSRALDGFARNRALNWLLPEQLVRVRAVK
jgi:ubiquinone/menaquinone biosynthesis C-methylase UbiE